MMFTYQNDCVKGHTPNLNFRNSLTLRNHHKRSLSKLSNPSQTLPKSINNQYLPQIKLKPIKTQHLIKPRRIKVPPLFNDQINPNILKTAVQQSSITDISQTQRFKNYHSNQQSKLRFRTKKLSRPYLPIKNNLSQVFYQKNATQPQENNKKTQNQNKYENKKLAETSTTEKTTIRKNKDKKCLIAVNKKLPFSLQKRPKRKLTQKTDFSNSNQQFFDLDVSVILDEIEVPDTPFITRDSELATVFNFA